MTPMLIMAAVTAGVICGLLVEIGFKLVRWWRKNRG